MKHNDLAMPAFPTGVDFYTVRKRRYSDMDRHVYPYLTEKRANSAEILCSGCSAMNEGHASIRMQGALRGLRHHAATLSRISVVPASTPASRGLRRIQQVQYRDLPAGGLRDPGGDIGGRAPAKAANLRDVRFRAPGRHGKLSLRNFSNF